MRRLLECRAVSAPDDGVQRTAERTGQVATIEFQTAASTPPRPEEPSPAEEQQDAEQV